MVPYRIHSIHQFDVVFDLLRVGSFLFRVFFRNLCGFSEYYSLVMKEKRLFVHLI